MVQPGLVLLAALLLLLVPRNTGLPFTQQGRALTDEALRKFYYDLYDQETEPDPSQSHQFDLGDYFDSRPDKKAEEKKSDTKVKCFAAPPLYSTYLYETRLQCSRLPSPPRVQQTGEGSRQWRPNRHSTLYTCIHVLRSSVAWLTVLLCRR